MYILTVWTWLQALGDAVERPTMVFVPLKNASLKSAGMHLIISEAFDQYLKVE